MMDIDQQVYLAITEIVTSPHENSCNKFRQYTQLYKNFLEAPLAPGCRSVDHELEKIYNARIITTLGLTRILFQSQEDRLEFILTYG